eukprot:2490741-Amphidinium_carterae.1
MVSMMPVTWAESSLPVVCVGRQYNLCVKLAETVVFRMDGFEVPAVNNDRRQKPPPNGENPNTHKIYIRKKDNKYLLLWMLSVPPNMMTSCCFHNEI